MQLTRRGWAVLAVGAFAEVMAGAFGARSLNAVAAPVVVALLFGAVTLYRRDAPSVSRRRPHPGFPGETRTVRLTADADGPCTIRDRTPDALTARGTPIDLAAGGEASYELELLERGEHRLGPAEVTERDPLGVVVRTTSVAATTPVLVYPDVRAVAPNRTFTGLVERAGTPERQAFARLREYVPGDALRDVHWKSSAKRADGDLVVTEFADEDEGGVTIAVEGETGHGDPMASAAASVAVYLLDAGLAVGLATPAGDLTQRKGDEHREELLELLARVSAGRVGDRVDADVRVRADSTGVTIEAGDARFPFADLLDDEDNESTSDVREGVVAA